MVRRCSTDRGGRHTKLSQIALIEVSNERPYALDRLLPLLAAAIDGNPVTR